nr:hypothetical protein [Candidatus Woesearchaeota archaeon]
NNLNNLTYSDFEPLLNQVSKTQKSKRVKAGGISGLKEGEDYLTVPVENSQENISLGISVNAYMPLNHEASKLIASKSIGGCEGKWCTAYQKDSSYWNDYTRKNDIVLIYILIETEGDTNKYAIAYDYDSENMEIFNQYDRKTSEEDFEEDVNIKADDFIINSVVSKAYTILQNQPNEMDEIVAQLKKGEVTEDLVDKMNEFLDSEDLEYYGGTLLLDMDSSYFNDSTDDTYVNGIVLSEDWDLYTPSVDYMTNEQVFDSVIGYSLNSKNKKLLIKNIKEIYPEFDEDILDKSNYQDYYEYFEENNIIEIHDGINVAFRNAMETAEYDAFYTDITEAYDEAVSDMGSIFSNRWEGMIELNLSTLADIFSEYTSDEGINLTEHFELSLGINWDYYQADIDDKNFNNIVEQNIIEISEFIDLA